MSPREMISDGVIRPLCVWASLFLCAAVTTPLRAQWIMFSRVPPNPFAGTWYSPVQVSMGGGEGENCLEYDFDGNCIAFEYWNNDINPTWFHMSLDGAQYPPSRFPMLSVQRVCQYYGDGTWQCWYDYEATGMATFGAGAHRFDAAITCTGSCDGITNVTRSYTFAATATITSGVAVRSELSERQHFTGTSASQRFFIKNKGDVAATYTLSWQCAGAVSGCSVTPTSVALSPGESRVATLTYSVGAAGSTGSGMVKAVDVAQSSLRDSATVAVTSIGSQLAVVSVVDVNPGTTIERDLCLTIAAGSGAAFECGDLRIVHPLPAIRTLNKARVPTLLYNSALADPYPIVAANVTLASGSPRPDSVEAVLTVGGAERARGRWAGSDWTPGETRRIALGYSAVADTTKVYDYTLAVATIRPDSVRVTSVTGKIILVNRRGSAFGAGWWVAGLERIEVLSDSNRLWVGGDGSARLYTRVSSNAWAAANLDRPDTLIRVGARYLRRLPGGVTVKFNSAGQHDTTVNRLGHTTAFRYDGSGRLFRILLPPDTTKLYEFAYNQTSGQLDSVIAPPIGTERRAIKLTISGSRVTNLRDPDLRTVSFGYDGTTNRIASRTDRRNTVTSYSYDAAKKLWRSHIPLATDSIRGGFRALDVLGLATATPKTATDTAMVYTSVFGARQFTTGPNFIAQETKFWLDRYGAPRRIVNALGQQTLTKREDGQWPALATELVAANGFTTRAGYDRRGNIVRRLGVNPLGTGLNDTTRYHWDARWDFADSIVTPTGVITMLAYDTLNGNRLWQQVGGDLGRLTIFRYGNTLKLLSSTVLPDTPPDSLEYDARGNLAATRTPRGFWTSHYKDAVGRDTLVVTPIDSTDKSRGGAADSTSRQRQRTAYDVMGRDTLQVNIGPPWSITGPEAFTARRAFDFEGNLLRLTRTSSPDPNPPVGQMITQWRYDVANRPVAEVAPDGKVDSTVYDPAGNRIQELTRRTDPVSGARLSITMGYDALNRLTKRVVPQVNYPGRTEGIAAWSPSPDNPAYPYYSNNPSGGFTIAKDSTLFTYDVLGNDSIAVNAAAEVWRTYYVNGQLKTETQKVRTVAPIDSGGSFDPHSYTITYRYDLDGRRTVLKHPAQLAPLIGGSRADSARFAYDPRTGALASVYDPLGNQYQYFYTLRDELQRVQLPGGVATFLTYDADGNRTLDSVAASQPFRRTTLQYDGRGKLLRSANRYGPEDTLTSTYTGLGYLERTVNVAHALNDAGDTVRQVFDDLFGYDGIGNSIYHRHVMNRTERGHTLTTAWEVDPDYLAGTGRLAVSRKDDGQVVLQHDTVRYDGAGNTEFTWQSYYDNVNAYIHVQLEDRASYYGADGTLRAADYRTVGRFGTPGLHATFEEYRYDPYGRRVWVRARRYCNDGEITAYDCGVGVVRRTVWDRSQELWEIEAPGDVGTPADTMENDTAAVRRALDDRWGRDYNPYFGRVAYTYGLGVDQPVGIMRVHYAHDPTGTAWDHWDPFGIIPLWNYVGQADGGYFAGGAPPCKAAGRCVYIAWPLGWDPLSQGSFIRAFWHGTLVEGKRDLAGTMYRRNRSYDPATGRFTQEDPIGLAGGLNLYGFAGGDPVNFGDPFGLCSEEQRKNGGCPQKGDVADQQKQTWVNPTGGEVRGCDKQGCGNFGAPRGDRTHAGADYVARAGQDVVAVTSGEVTNVGYPYGDDLSFRYVEITGSDGYVARQFYIQPGASVQTGARVQAGQVLGTQQRLGGRYPGITEHVHVEIRRSGRLIDPTTLIPNPVP